MFHRTLVALSLVAMAADCMAQTATFNTSAVFARPQQMIDIGGRRLNLYCSGQGPVTVVFDSYSGGPAWTWFKVQPAVAKQTRACVYDRAGLGFSDPSPRAATSGHAVEDLHTLLKTAGIAPPYVMVGSSYGGANVQLYAYRHPEQVGGLVLVDAHHEDETERANKVTNGKLAEVFAMSAQMTQDCIEHAEKGLMPGTEAFAKCVGPLPADYGRELAAVYMAYSMSAPRRRAAAAEEASFKVSEAELRAARRPVGALPVVALVRTINPFSDPGKPPSPLAKAMEAENLKVQTEVAALSTRGETRVISGAGHIIHETKPEAVIKAVLDVVRMISPEKP